MIRTANGTSMSAPATAEERMLRIKKELAARTSPAHVPSVIVAVRDVPRTQNNKVSERAARDAANGELPKNATALKNPEVLREIMDHPEIASVREHATSLEEWSR